jgi:hypothetical protein
MDVRGRAGRGLPAPGGWARVAANCSSPQGADDDPPAKGRGIGPQLGPQFRPRHAPARGFWTQY